MSANPYRDTSSGLPETHNHKPLRYAEANAWDEGHASGAAEERERIWRGVRALIWMVERHPTKDVIYDAHIRRLARDLKAAHGALRNFYSKHRSPS